MVIIRSFISYLYKNGILAEDISTFLKLPRKEDKHSEYLTKKDIEKIDRYLDYRKGYSKSENLRDRIIFYLGIKCGLRKSEMIKLDWDNINFGCSEIKILNSKGGNDRVLYFNGELKDILIDYRKLNRYYIGSVVRGKYSRRISSCSIQKIVRKIYKESGVYRKGLKVHSLRHTYAQLLLEKNIPLPTIQILLGHKSLETTAGYLHISTADLKKAAL